MTPDGRARCVATSLLAVSLVVGCVDAANPTPQEATPPARYGDQDCRDFSTCREVRAFYEAEGGPARDPHRLDADRDGTPCEVLC